MMNKRALEEKLKEINEIITVQHRHETQIGVLNGLSGISLFQFYYSKYLDTNAYTDIGEEILTNAIDKINEGYQYSTFCTGIAGFGWVFDHLVQEDFIEADTDELLSELDQYLYTTMIVSIKSGNYDFLHGAIGYALYFTNRYRNTNSAALKNNYKTYLLEFIELLQKNAEKNDDGSFKWLSILNIDTKEMGYNLSLSHGMSSIVGLLTKLYEYDDFKIKVEVMLKGTIKYIMRFKNTDTEAFSLFPSWIPKDGFKKGEYSRLAWCYGDLGIGIRLWFASKALNDKKLADEAVLILTHAATRITPEKSLVKDASICHGSYGNAQVFHRIYKETKDPVFKKAAEFWIQEGLNMAIHKDGYAGYKQWKGEDKDWGVEISLLEGITGIGLTIIDYLATFESNWDECLMIS